MVAARPPQGTGPARSRAADDGLWGPKPEQECLCRCKAEVHQGADYTVVMLGAQSTEEASIHIFGDTRAESLAIAEHVAVMWNAARVPSPPKKG